MANVELNRNAGENSIFLTFDATDKTGFDYANFNFIRIKEDGSLDWDNDERIRIDDWNSLTIGGSPNDGTFVGLLQLSSNSQEGKYELESFYISDEADNYKYYSVNTSTVNNVITKSWEKEAKEALGGHDPTKLSFSIIGEKIVEQAQSYVNDLHSLQDGDLAPDFSAITINNENIDLSELRGKVVLIEFWSTTCGPCIKELPNLKEIYALNKDNKDFVMIGVSLDSDIEKVNSFIEINDLKWHQIFDDGYGEISQLYNAVYIPRTYLIDRNGNIAHKDLRENDLKNAVSSMLIN